MVHARSRAATPSSASINACDSVVISPLTVPAGITLNLTDVKAGATITFNGITTFGTKLLEGPLVLLKGENLNVSGPGTLDGQGAYYWKQGQSVTRPVFFRLNHVDYSTLSGFTLKNSPFRTFSILSSTATTVTGLAVRGNKIINNANGLRIKTIVGLKGLVSNVTYIDNTLTNVKNAIVMHSDYSKSKGGYTGTASSQVQITDVAISGLSGTATNLYDVASSPSVVSNWTWSDINVTAKSIGSCTGQPDGVKCE